MRRLIAGLVLVLSMVLLLTGCPTGTEMTVEQRVAAFIADINVSPPDYDTVKTHFSSDMADYNSLQLEAFWELTYFAQVNQQFVLGTMTLDDITDTGYTGGVTYTGDIDADGVPGTYTATFILVPDANALLVENWLIREIQISDGSDPIYSYW